MKDIREQIYTLINTERDRQDAKFGIQDHPNYVWLAILVEEVGEVAQATLISTRQQLCDELVQVAAVAIAQLEALKKAGVF